MHLRPVERPLSRGRLLDAMATALAERGYVDVTPADVARLAGVTPREFHDEFASTEECVLELYAVMSEQLLAHVAAAVASRGELDEQIAAATMAYLTRLQADPVIARTLFIDILAAGPAGLELRREIKRRFAHLLRTMVEEDRLRHPGRPPLTHEMAMAAVGGVHELILESVGTGRTGQLLELAGPMRAFLGTVMLAR